MTTEDKYKILKQRANEIRSPLVKEEPEENFLNGLEFSLNGERYFIDTQFANEVFFIEEFTELPGTPDFLAGIINLRGRILSLIDIRKFFNLSSSSLSNLNRVIAVEYNGIEVGILTDEIIGSSMYRHSEFQEKLFEETHAVNNFIQGVSKDGLILIDMKKLLTDEKLIINDEI